MESHNELEKYQQYISRAENENWQINVFNIGKISIHETVIHLDPSSDWFRVIKYSGKNYCTIDLQPIDGCLKATTEPTIVRIFDGQRNKISNAFGVITFNNNQNLLKYYDIPE